MSPAQTLGPHCEKCIQSASSSVRVEREWFYLRVMSSWPSHQQQIVPADSESSDGSSSSLQRRLVAPRLQEILRHPIRVPDDLCLVEEGLCHPEKPEVFLSASIQFLTQKLNLRLARLQGDRSLSDTTCFFCFKQKHVAFSSCPNCRDAHDGINYKTVFSASTVEQGNHVRRNTSLVTPRDYPRSYPEMKSERLTLRDYQNLKQNNLVLEGGPEWCDIKLSNKNRGHCIFYENQLPVQVTPPIPLNDVKQNPDCNEIIKPNVKITKASKHYTKVHSAVLHFIGAKPKKRTKYLQDGNCIKQSSDESYKNYPQTNNENKETCQTSPEIGLPREEECISMKSVSLGELSDSTQEDSSNRRHRSTSSNSPRSPSKISGLFSNLFNKNDKHLKAESKRQTLEETQDNSSKVQDEICNENSCCLRNISTPPPQGFAPDGIQSINYCETSAETRSRANPEDSKNNEEQYNRYVTIPQQHTPAYSAHHIEDRDSVLSRGNVIQHPIEGTFCYRDIPTQYSGIESSNMHHDTIEHSGNTQDTVFHNSTYRPRNIPNRSSDDNDYQTQNFGTFHRENDNDSTHKREYVLHTNMHCPSFIPVTKQGYIVDSCVPDGECQTVLDDACLSIDTCGLLPKYESSEKGDFDSLRRNMSIESQNNPRRMQPWNKQPPIVCYTTGVEPMFPQIYPSHVNGSDITTRNPFTESPQQKHVTIMTPKNSVTYVTRTVSQLIETKQVVKSSEDEPTEIWDKEASFTTLVVSHVNEESKTPTHLDSALSRIVSHLAQFSNQSERDVLSLVISQPQEGTSQASELPTQQNRTTQMFEQSTSQNTSNQMSDKYFQKRQTSQIVNQSDVKLCTVKKEISVTDGHFNGEKEFNCKSESARISTPLQHVVEISVNNEFYSQTAGLEIQQNATLSQNLGIATNRTTGYLNLHKTFRETFEPSHDPTTSSGITGELSTTHSSQCPSFNSHVSRQLSKISVYESSTSRSTCSDDSLTDLDEYSGKVHKTTTQIENCGQSRSDECRSHKMNLEAFAREAGMTPQMVRKLRGYPSAEK